MTSNYRDEKCFVYAIEAENGLLKIGASEYPARRASSICASSPVRTRLIIAIPGVRSDERIFHELFVAHRSWNEWFRIEGAVLWFVETYRGFGVDKIPEWSEVASEDYAQNLARAVEKRSARMKELWATPSQRQYWLNQLSRGRPSFSPQPTGAQQ